MKNLKSSIIKILISLLVVAVIIVGAYFALKALGITELSREQIQAYVEKAGFFGPFVFIIITFLQVLLSPIPSTVIILVGNYLFGPWLSFLYLYIGMISGSVVAFYLGRLIGKPYLNWVAGGKENLDALIKRLKGRERVFLFFMFLFPFFPDDMLCAVAGALPITFSFFFATQLITRIVAIGGNLLFLSGEFIAYEGVGLVIIIIAVVIALIALVLSVIYSEKLNEIFDKFIDKITHKRKNKKVGNEEIPTEEN